MDEETNLNEPAKPVPLKSRPVLLTALCLFSFVFFGFLSLLFLAGLFNSGWVERVMNQYLPTGGYSGFQVIMNFFAAFSLHALAFAGTVFIWNLRKTGFYLLGLACLGIALYQFFFPLMTIAPPVIYLFFILLFGLFFKSLRLITFSPTKTY